MDLRPWRPGADGDHPGAMVRIAVIGAGSWGTTLAGLCASTAVTSIWALEPEVVAGINEHHVNDVYLPGIRLPEALTATGELRTALGSAEVVVVAVPSQHLRGVMEQAGPLVPGEALVVSVVKGIEAGSWKRMTEVLGEVLATHDPTTIGVLAGPNLAREVAEGQPSATCVAFPSEHHAERIQQLLMGDTLRVYTSDDVVGCEIGGAVKNVIAIAAGVADGLGFGMNAKAALITRGLAELARLGVAMGGNPLTFLGLAGAGDLVVTCSSPQSRNHTVGEQLGRGRALADIEREMHMVAEGVRTAPGVIALAARAGVDTPICESVAALLAGDITPLDVTSQLMHRRPTRERAGLPHGR